MWVPDVQAEIGESELEKSLWVALNFSKEERKEESCGQSLKEIQLEVKDRRII
jgi:hypothetical protein